jgi:hypothetical protein
MRKTLFVLALLASALSIPLTAHADTIDQFTFNFPHTSDGFAGVFTIDIPASPPPNYYGGLGTCSAPNCIVVLGTDPTESTDWLVIFTEVSPTETEISYAHYSPGSPFPPARAYGTIFDLPALFTGPVSAPTFLTGTFNGVYRDVPVFVLPPFPGTLTIEPLTNSTVPEPSSFALMATGILGAITTLRYRRSIKI